MVEVSIVYCKSHYCYSESECNNSDKVPNIPCFRIYRCAFNSHISSQWFSKFRDSGNVVTRDKDTSVRLLYTAYVSAY